MHCVLQQFLSTPGSNFPLWSYHILKESGPHLWDTTSTACGKFQWHLDGCIWPNHFMGKYLKAWFCVWPGKNSNSLNISPPTITGFQSVAIPTKNPIACLNIFNVRKKPYRGEFPGFRGLGFLVMNDLIAFTNIASLLIQWEVLTFKSCNCKLEFRPALPKAISTGRNTKMSNINIEQCWELWIVWNYVCPNDMDSKDDQWW